MVSKPNLGDGGFKIGGTKLNTSFFARKVFTCLRWKSSREEEVRVPTKTRTVDEGERCRHRGFQRKGRPTGKQPGKMKKEDWERLLATDD
jgi:hypothetical protein